VDNQSHKLRFFITSPHPCNYLDDREATSVFADPYFPKDKLLYSRLVSNGFRRSGEHLYKPHCMGCSECVPVRIPVNQFKMRRNQKRTWKLNQDLSIQRFKASFQEEHYQLYTKYQSGRHPDGGMDNSNRDDYIEFLLATWSDCYLFEFRLEDKLLAVSVVDELEDAYSAIYTFFDTDFNQRSLGKFTILTLIEKSKQEGFSSLYLGYWISNCDKMKYKIEYQPIECLIDEEWKKYDAASFNSNNS
jgi:leucyl-tRNA---protein transferase